MEFEVDDDGTLLAVVKLRTYRFLFSDASTVDVVAPRIDSDVRAAVLDYLGDKTLRIEGVAEVPEAPDE